VHVPYKVHESKNMKARGLQTIIKTLTILKNWRYIQVTTLTGAQWAHNVQRKEVCGVHSAHLWAGKSPHFLSRVGGEFFE
jgi:hypothetical protein